VLLTALTARDADLGQHVDSVAVWSERLGIELGLGRAELRELRFAAELHDIGKIAIPDSIVSKPGPLDDAEFEFIRNHTIIGERIISASPALAGVGRIVRATHERFDGGGYPDRIAGDEIPLGARIIAVCDVYDAMVSERPYRETITPGRACEELWRCSGTQFDPIVVEAFTTLAAVLDPPDRASLDRAPAVT
jgi:HD-GYP domain-containing protein (c-di-GMP phosphodiesterase class II)